MVWLIQPLMVAWSSMLTTCFCINLLQRVKTIKFCKMTLTLYPNGLQITTFSLMVTSVNICSFPGSAVIFIRRHLSYWMVLHWIELRCSSTLGSTYLLISRGPITYKRSVLKLGGCLAFYTEDFMLMLTPSHWDSTTSHLSGRTWNMVVRSGTHT